MKNVKISKINDIKENRKAWYSPQLDTIFFNIAQIKKDEIHAIVKHELMHATFRNKKSEERIIVYLCSNEFNEQITDVATLIELWKSNES